MSGGGVVKRTRGLGRGMQLAQAFPSYHQAQSLKEGRDYPRGEKVPDRLLDTSLPKSTEIAFPILSLHPPALCSPNTSWIAISNTAYEPIPDDRLTPVHETLTFRTSYIF